VQLMASNVAGAAFQNDQTFVRAILRRDMKLRHPLAFSTMTGVLA
jgi:hypothetical protein